MQAHEVAAITIAEYDRMAAAYRCGTADHDVSQNIAALLDAIEGKAPHVILDLGCGPGRDLRRFTALGHEVVGLDGSGELAAIARAETDCEVLHQDFLALDLPLARFDGIFANASLFHVPSSQLARVLGDLEATLKPGGVLFCSNPRGHDEEGWAGGRYGCFHDLETWRAYVTGAGFRELHHYYRPSGPAAGGAAVAVARHGLAQESGQSVPITARRADSHRADSQGQVVQCNPADLADRLGHDRRGAEVAHLFEAGELRLPDTRTGGRAVPLAPSAVRLLVSLPRDDNPRVIAGRKPGSHLTDLQRPWRRIRARARLDDVRIHDLRHSLASRALALGEGLPMIGKLLGHTQVQTTARYAHLARDTVSPHRRQYRTRSGGRRGAFADAVMSAVVCLAALSGKSVSSADDSFHEARVLCGYFRMLCSVRQCMLVIPFQERTIAHGS